jgi:ferredoxin--NADP+ reductase
MSYVITRSCCNDASCVAVCPVNCIHPAPGEPDYLSTEMLYIDPETCIECSACVLACPVDAIRAADDLTADEAPFLQLNADYYKRNPMSEFDDMPVVSARKPPATGLRVAVVGSGPSGSYAAAELLAHRGVEVDVYERLLTPYGLLRSGVAPDHAPTKAVESAFPYKSGNPAIRLHLGVEIGSDVTHEELLRHHHAVIYAVGAAGARRLGIPGEDLPGSHSAAGFVAWYNGHPDAADSTFDLEAERAVVIGNGNVALDVARILSADPDLLAKTDIADHALAALRGSRIREVVVLGRRSVAGAAFTAPELIALLGRADIDVIADVDGLTVDEYSRSVVNDPGAEPTLRRKIELVVGAAGDRPAGERRRIRLRFLTSPVAILGMDRVTGVAVAQNELTLGPDGEETLLASAETSVIEAGLVLRAIGYQASAIPGLPFDERRGMVPNEQGRVLSEGVPMTGAYVVGWIQRGATGVIGTNRHGAAVTVDALVADYHAGLLSKPVDPPAALDELLRERGCPDLDIAAWERIDAAERAAGAAVGTPRRKFVRRDELLRAAQGEGPVCRT